MKARVINEQSKYYGKIVNVKKLEDSRFFANRYGMIYGKGVFFGCELEFNIEKEHNINSEPDWSAFRREAAKDILCALLSANPYYSLKKDTAASASIEYADELINQLKEGQA